MLSMGFLLGSAVYSTYAYSDDIINSFREKSDASFQKIRDAIDSGRVQRHLKGDIVHAGFKRLT
jgi:hypothetical protein